MLLFQLAYPAVIQAAFGLFSCKTLADGSSIFSLAPHLDCNSDDAQIVSAVAAAALAIWGVGFPLVLGTMILRFSDNPKYSFVIVSFGYQPKFRYWEAWECIKKFLILLIITFLGFSPELAATVLLLFLSVAMIVSALAEPFVSSLVNTGHVACDFLVFWVLLTGLLSTSAGKTWPKEVEAMSISVVTYATSLLAGVTAVLVVEVGSHLRPGGTLHAVWGKFLHNTGSKGVASAAKRLSKLMGFAAVAPSAQQDVEAAVLAAREATAALPNEDERVDVQVRSAALDKSSDSPP